MKKTILSVLVAVLTLSFALPAMAQTDTVSPSRVQQFKQYANVTVQNTTNGVAIVVTGTTFGYDQKLVNLYFERLFKRGWSYKDRVNVVVTQIANGFQVNVEGTQAKYTEKIQQRSAQLNLPAKINTLFLQFLANHGIK